MSVDERRGWPRDPRILPADLAAAVSLGGEMGRRFADFDWTGHPLGAPQSWPVEMRSVIAMVLTSSFPTVLWLDADELFLIYNDAYIPILADRHPAALGQRGQYAWWDVWPSVKPMLEGVLETGQATWSRDLRLPILTAGRRRERFFTFTYSPLVGADGSTFGIICPSYETTERVLSERRLQLLNAVASVVMDTNSVDDALTAAIAACERQSADVPFVAAYLCEPESDEAVLRAATPSVRALLPRTLSRLTKSVPMPRTRADTHVIDAVAERIDGIDTALGDECPDQALLLPLGEGAASGALLVGTNPLCPLDGDYVNVCQLLAGQLSSALSSAVSYEQQRRRADGLAELDRAKTAFLTNVSHEFRTPLTLLAGPLEDAIAAVEAGSAIGDQLRIARRNAGRLQRLVDSLLDFSRVEAGRATADLVCTDVGALTAHVASSFAQLCQRAGLELILDCHPVVADVDSGMWETILLNLLSNAVKYTLAGSITVSARKDGSLCRVAIRDTGVGIADGDLKRLGERFFRAEGGAGRSVEGTGIGLSLVQGLVDLHGGTVEFVSEIGAGTAVIIRVPRSKNGEPVAHSPAGLLDSPYLIEAGQWVASRDDDVVRAADGHDLILIADDNADMRAYLQRILSAHWSTVLAADGVEAIELARTLRPSVVVTDVMMPRLNGFELVDAIRSDPMLEATPVLMLSARADAEASSEGFARGADDYLPKPFTSRDLVDRVAARVASARRDRASRQSLDAHAETVHNFAQLEAALRSADTVTAIVSALEVAAPKPGDNPLICLGLLDTEGSNLRFEYGSAITPELRDRYHVAAMDTPIVPVDVVKSGQPMIITDTLDLGSRYDHVVGETRDMVRSCISQPLHDGDGKIIGSLGMLWSQPREFTPDELAWAAQVARATQSAVDRIRNVQREHRIAVDFQDHLLDLDHASTVAVVAAVYQPGGEAMRVGGDWYLVMPLEQQRQVAVSVGDVVGHGLPAAIAMSRLRAGVAASALTDASPEAVLENLDRYAATVPGGRCATVSYAVIDDGSHDGDGVARVRYSCAGHPFPLLVTPDKAPAFLPDGRRPPVAVLDDPLPPSVAVHDVPPGSVLLFYTDGLIERPGEGLDHGFARLLGAAAYRADLPVGDLCDELLDRMCPDGGYTDDVVLLALRPCHSSARSFATVVSASLGNVADARHRLRDWLIDVGADPKRESDILLATGEAVTNAIEHGSGNDDSMTVSIEAFVRGTTIAATVSDAGQWSGDSSASQRSLERGRGLTMINGLADDVRTVRSGAGTRVTLTFDRAVLPAAGLVEGVTP